MKQENAMDKETNYYLSLELPLDPPVRDKASLEAAIQKKLTEWNQGVNNPTKGLLCKSLAAKVPEIKKALLSDDASRDAIIADALRIVKSSVAELLEAVAKSGSMTEAQVKEICKKMPQLSEKTIRAMIKVPIVQDAGSTFKVPKKPADPPIKPTDNMQMDKFAKNLTVIHKKDIYDFLGCSRISTPAAICALADEELEKARKAPCKTAEVSARQELAGLITSYFKKADAKEAYDLALKTYIGQKKLTEIFAIRCISKTIEWKSYKESIADCQAIGMSQEEAEFFVYDFYCNKRHCPPPVVPVGEKSESAIHYCRACFAPNPEDASACQSCGTPFKVKCPKCRQMVNVESPFCPKCGFPIGDIPLALKLIKDGKLAVADKDLDRAEKLLDQALVYWPENPECASLKADIAKRRAAAKAEAERKRAEAEAEEKRKRAEAEAEEKRKRAEAEAERKRLEHVAAVEAASAHYVAAIHAGDWDGAEKAAQERAKLGDGSTEKWRVEIAKEKQSRRQKLEDHCKKAIECLATVFQNNFEEADAALEKAESALAALEREFRSSQEVVRTRTGIKSARQKLADKKRDMAISSLGKAGALSVTGSRDGSPIVVSWKPAAGGTTATKWRIRRRERGGAAKVVASVETHSFRDETTRLGIEYEYGVAPSMELDMPSGGKTLFANDDAEVWSEPVARRKPMSKDSFTGTGQGMDGFGGIVTLQWKMPEGMSFDVPHRFFLSRGDNKISSKDVTSFHGSFSDPDVSVGASLDYALSFELCGMDMGTSRIHVDVEKMSPPPSIGRFSFRRSPQGTLLVGWEWPNGLDLCLWGVSDREARKPEDIAKTARRHVSKAVFDEKGGVAPVVPPGGAPCWLTVFGIRSFGDREFFSSGKSIPLRETRLDYIVENHQGGFLSKRKPAVLVIRSSTGYFPDMEVRAGRSRTEVLSRRGGRIADNIGQESSSASEKRIVLDGNVHPGEFVRLYLSHADAENCKLNHPVDFEVK